MPILTDDRIETTSAGFLFPAAETWTFAAHVLVSSTSNAGVYCDYNSATLINHGTILSAQPSSTTGLGQGVSVEANDFTLSNEADGFILGYSFGILLAGPRAAITNHGKIESFQFAIDCTTAVTELDVGNSGVIQSRYFAIASYAAGGTIRNSGLITAGYTAIDTNVAGHVLKVINEIGGTIRGGDRAVTNFGSTGLSLENHGTIIGEIYLASGGADAIRNSGTIAGKVFLGEGADRFNGLGGKSGAVSGGDGNDTLAGGPGLDWLDGGNGSDLLVGRGGKDKFVFSGDLINVPHIDTIKDFTVNVDKILLGTNIFELNPSGVLAAAAFHVGGQAADASDRIIYNPNTGALFYDDDGRGGHAQVKFAQLTPHLALDNADFIILPIE